ncbi:MAG: peptide deformylase [Chloroflexota bacterium]|nr:peptide deformylase [Chloroflexota bacterium]
MAVLGIRIVPDPVLRQKAKRIRVADSSIQRLIDDMVETMREAHGVGLAAPQVAKPVRLIVIETSEDGLVTLLNPEVVKSSGERNVVEGCLSVPGYQGEIRRAESIVVKGRDRKGKEVRIKAKDILAQALEHEIDHLNGVLYVDYINDKKKLKKINDQDHRETQKELI